jgi:hypothetical protein
MLKYHTVTISPQAMEVDMPKINLKEKLIEDIEDLPQDKMKEVIDFVSYLKLKEDEWFIDYVNRRGALAKKERKAGRGFTRLEDLQKEYR